MGGYRIGTECNSTEGSVSFCSVVALDKVRPDQSPRVIEVEDAKHSALHTPYEHRRRALQLPTSALEGIGEEAVLRLAHGRVRQDVADVSHG